MAGLTANEDDSLKIHFNEVSKVPLLTREEEVSLAKRSREGDKSARDSLIKANMKFVAKIANQYKGCGVEYEDLLSEGYIGLMKAAEHFDEQKGYHFISYAVWWIRQRMLKFILDSSRMIRLPVNKEAEIRKLNAAMKEISLDDAKSEDEIVHAVAEKCGMEEARVSNLMNISKSVLSLDSCTGESGDRASEAADMSGEHSPEKSAMNAVLNSEIKDVISSLGDAKASYVLDMRYGLSGQGEWTLKDLSEKMNLSRERVRQIEQGALRKLRASNRCKDVLMDYVA